MAQDIAAARNTKPRLAGTKRANKERLARALINELAQRKRQLEYSIEESTLYSPLAGIVAGVYVRPEDDWNTRNVQPAFEILDPTELVAEVVAPADVVQRMQQGDRAWVQLPPLPGGAQGEVVVATVESVSDQDVPVQENQQIVDVRYVSVRLPRRLPHRLVPGDEVQVALRP